MKSRSRFWIGTGLALVVGVPCALLARVRWQPRGETEHVHGGDPRLEADLARLSGGERLTRLREAAQEALPVRRLVVAEALVREHSVEGLALAKTLLTDNDSEVRIKAAYALMQNGAEPERPFIQAALQDDDLWLRQEVCQWAATNAGRPGSAVGSWLVPNLMARLDESSESQRAFATSALAKLTGKPWRYKATLPAATRAATLQHWKDWWQVEKGKYPVTPVLPDITPQRTDLAPAVMIQTLDGRTVSPATSGKVTLVNFWGTWCPPCRQEVPDLQRLHEHYAAQGVELVGVALSEKEGADGLRAWCQTNKLTYPQALAEDSVTEAYGDVHEVPITVLIDKRGRIRSRWQGERDFTSFAAVIERLLKE